MSVDDLAHAHETKAEVLRTVAYMSPERARAFLLDLVQELWPEAQRRPVEVVAAVAPAAPLPMVEEPPTAPVIALVRSRVRHCLVCKSPDHDRRKCPRLRDAG